ncbi:MAG: chemotaxis signal transduction protein [Clostridia bacterium]|nr:chemotaxis signal transduction protein [Clostridia bacterium]
MDFKTSVYEADVEEEDIKNQYLIFKLASDSYGLDIKNVTEIVNIQKITVVPDLPQYIKGIISLRGKIIPVIDVRIRFGMEAIAYNDRTCIIIIDWEGFSVGLIVEGVSDVLTFNDDDLLTPPEFNNEENKFIKFIGKVGDELKLILNCETLLSDEDKNLL